MTAENGVVERLRAQVLGSLSERQRADQVSGRPALRGADEQAFGRQLIADALDADAREALAAGNPVRPPEEDDTLSQAVFDALFRLDRLQRLLDDPSIENINANGCDQVWVRYADGRHERVEPIADSDEELVELLRNAAARLGIGERRFDWLATTVAPAAGRVTSLRGDGGRRPAVPLDPPPPLPAGHARRPRRDGHPRPGAAGVLPLA